MALQKLITGRKEQLSQPAELSPTRTSFPLVKVVCVFLFDRILSHNLSFRLGPNRKMQRETDGGRGGEVKRRRKG
jgi:hypothetical protein